MFEEIAAAALLSPHACYILIDVIPLRKASDILVINIDISDNFDGRALGTVSEQCSCRLVGIDRIEFQSPLTAVSRHVRSRG